MKWTESFAENLLIGGTAWHSPGIVRKNCRPPLRGFQAAAVQFYRNDDSGRVHALHFRWGAWHGYVRGGGGADAARAVPGNYAGNCHSARWTDCKVAAVPARRAERIREEARMSSHGLRTSIPSAAYSIGTTTWCRIAACCWHVLTVRPAARRRPSRQHIGWGGWSRLCGRFAGKSRNTTWHPPASVAPFKAASHNSAAHLGAFLLENRIEEK